MISYVPDTDVGFIFHCLIGICASLRPVCKPIAREIKRRYGVTFTWINRNDFFFESGVTYVAINRDPSDIKSLRLLNL